MDGLPCADPFAAQSNACAAHAHACADNRSYTNAVATPNTRAQCWMSHSCAKGGVREVL